MRPRTMLACMLVLACGACSDDTGTTKKKDKGVDLRRDVTVTEPDLPMQPDLPVKVDLPKTPDGKTPDLPKAPDGKAPDGKASDLPKAPDGKKPDGAKLDGVGPKLNDRCVNAQQ